MNGAIEMDARASRNMEDHEFLPRDELPDFRFENGIKAGEDEMKGAASCDGGERFGDLARSDRGAVHFVTGEFFEQARGVAEWLDANAAVFVEILEIDLMAGFDAGLGNGAGGADAGFGIWV